MPTFKQGDVVKVPFPYTDRSTRQSRPALVVSPGGIEAAHGLLWVVMITSAENRGWPGDVSVGNLATVGLPAPSVIRSAKIATIEASDAARLGKVSTAVLRQVTRRIGDELGVAPALPAA
jgi:mRNA interferase MazF